MHVGVSCPKVQERCRESCGAHTRDGRNVCQPHAVRLGAASPDVAPHTLASAQGMEVNACLGMPSVGLEILHPGVCQGHATILLLFRSGARFTLRQ